VFGFIFEVYLQPMKQLISICLSVLLLASSTGITYAQHFCGEYKMLSEITLGEKHLSCGMAMEMPGCEDESADHDCCDNEYVNVETDDTFAKASFDISFNTQFVAAFVSVFILQTPENFPDTSKFIADYDPPPLERDIQILYETFLI
jgi:hypothetical protein